MANKIRRIAICTSVMQVVNAAAAMRLEESGSLEIRDHLVIFHPHLDGAVSKMVSLGRRVGFHAIHNFTDQAKIITELLSLRSFKMHAVKQRHDTNGQIMKLVNDMRRAVAPCDFDRIYCREPRQNEAFFLRNVLRKKAYEKIEDGIGNYSKHDKWWVLRIKRLLFDLKFRIAQWILVKRGVSNVYVKHIRPNGFRVNEHFMVHPWPGATSIGKAVRDILKNLYPQNDGVQARALILGTLLHHSGCISMDEEVVLNRRIVQYIQKYRGFDQGEIIFRPHPRSTENELEAYRSALPCRLDTVALPLAECNFSRPNLEAVYSLGSTASVNAKLLFGLDSYLVTSSSLKLCKKFNFIMTNAAKHFGLPVLRLN